VYLPLLIAAIAAFTALLAPASSMAATSCPPGQKANSKGYCENEPAPPPVTPPPVTPPPVTTVAVANEVVTGAVKVTLSVPGKGTLTLKGNAIKNLKVTVNSAGSVFIVLRATGKVLQHLENRGWTRRKQIFVTFTAADGSTQTLKLVVRFRKP